VTRIAVPRGSGIAVDRRFVWAPLARGIERIDRARGVVAGRLPVSGATDVVSAGGVLWAPTRDGALVEIDAATGSVIARFPGVVAPDTGSAMVTADRGLWLLDPQDARIVRFAGHRIVDEIPVVSGALPLLARTSEGLWTATGSSGSGAAEPTRLVRTDPDTRRVTGTVSLGAQAIHALFGAGRDLLVITDLGRVIVVRG
jgi:hypothetical protein